jgi:PST family polysaccharide transporter
MNEPGQSENQDYFVTNLSDVELKHQAIKGGAVSLIARGLALIIQFFSVVVLARLLSPDDFGIYTMATVFTSIFFVFQDVGLTDATIQAPSLNHETLSTLFWINSGIGLIIAIIICALSPVAVLFFKKPELKLILFVSSTAFIFWGISVQHLALLKRKLKFTEASIISVTSYFLGTLASIIGAMSGMRYWSLVLRDIVSALFVFILTWIYCKWRPGLPHQSSEVNKLVKFGLNSVGFYIVNYFSNYMDKAIIGKKFGSEPLGFYSRAYYIAVTPSSFMSQSLFHVAVSTLSKLREDQKKFQSYYHNALSLISFVGMPFSAFIVVLNKELVYILLGKQWAPTAGLFAILGISAGLFIIYQTNGWLHVSLGRSDRWFKWGIFSAVVLSSGFLVGMLISIKAIAWAYSIAIIVLTIPSLIYAGKPISITFSLLVKAISKNTMASIVSGLIFWQIKYHFLDKIALIPRVIVSFIVFTLSYLIILSLLHRRIKPIFDYYHQIKSGILGK